MAGDIASAARRRRLAAYLAVHLVVTGMASTALQLGLAGPARADTSAATATAATVTLAGGSVVDSGSATASNDGTQGTVVDGQQPLLSVLGAESPITAGVLVQNAVALDDGTSAACAGIVGSTGLVSIGAGGVCSVTTGGSPAQITLAATTVLKADAIVASCTASSDGPTTSTSVQVINGKVYTLGIPVATIASSPGPNSGLTVPGIATLALHSTTVPAGAGSIRARAMEISLLSSTVAVVVGAAGCGPNAVVVPTPAAPAAGMVILAMLAAGAGGAALIVGRLRRRGRPR
ncbi:hypothetical protein [Mangrovihabitans endophyticus]|uniref:Uncharacterized protein n=1 Tax=Mangrovihabitans endophyticus TaxID=1751298 RepID=A0A8J3C2R4_9ACTN|nr:hypothetical protein [Mangrovihabitans endophyticus]GGL06981.1 hypothetical protein GCM10012284_46470 [Mangrovihabitans endophyticus]